ncbi:MAG: hypothetical protein DIKNOCCD_01411 [bacterium]|nr:hypothetical protein [bacterium]
MSEHGRHGREIIDRTPFSEGGTTIEIDKDFEIDFFLTAIGDHGRIVSFRKRIEWLILKSSRERLAGPATYFAIMPTAAGMNPP